MKPPMDLKQLRAFLVVADMGNVTRAAEVLHLVQPAVSRQIRLLEEDIGVDLFERERHGMMLTEAGRALVGYARRALTELERARAELSGTVGAISGLVTIGLLPSTCHLLASPLVRAISESYPGIRLRIATGYAGTLQQWLESGEIDTALLFGVERSTAIQGRPLLEEALWVVAPPSAKLRSSRAVRFSDLIGKPLVLPSAMHGIRALVDHACAVAGVELTIAAETDAMIVQRSLVLAGHGWTILPAVAVADDIARKELSAAPLEEPAITRTISLGLPGNRITSAAANVTVEELAKCARKAVSDGRWPEGRWLAD